MEERPPIIAAVVRRHVEDAAFYWSQLDGSIDSPQLDAERASQFAALLTAHLEGIRAGREAAAAMALQALERWRKPNEAFVACVAALSLEGEGRRVAIEAAIRQVRLRWSSRRVHSNHRASCAPRFHRRSAASASIAGGMARAGVSTPQHSGRIRRRAPERTVLTARRPCGLPRRTGAH